MVRLTREGQSYQFEPEGFWSWVKAGNLRSTDQVQSTAGDFRPATAFSKLQPYLPKRDVIGDLFKAGLTLVAVLGGAQLLSDLLAPKSFPRASRLRKPNTERVSATARERTYLRDGGRCTYCGVHVAFRHVHIDHSISRANGGTNHLNNLRTSCSACNLAKGALNARQFVG